MSKLQTLKSIQDDPATVKAACFYVGWQLLSPHTWAYLDIFTGKRGEVDLSKLVKAVQAKRMMLDGSLNVGYNKSTFRAKHEKKTA